MVNSVPAVAEAAENVLPEMVSAAVAEAVVPSAPVADDPAGAPVSALSSLLQAVAVSVEQARACDREANFSLSHDFSVSLLKLAQMFRAERMRQQLLQSERGPNSVGACCVDGGVPTRELS